MSVDPRLKLSPALAKSHTFVSIVLPPSAVIFAFHCPHVWLGFSGVSSHFAPALFTLGDENISALVLPMYLLRASNRIVLGR